MNTLRDWITICETLNEIIVHRDPDIIRWFGNSKVTDENGNMKYSELFESPLNSYEIHGDFEEKTPERKYLTSAEPVFRKSFTRMNYKINIYVIDAKPFAYRMYNLPALGQIKDIKDEIFLLNKYNIKKDNMAINFCLYSHAIVDEERSIFTPWVMVHRLMHAIALYSISNNNTSPNLSVPLNIFIDFVAANLKYLINEATMKSARENNLDVAEELIEEFLTQYLYTGKITLKTDKDIEQKLNHISKQIFDNCVGEIFISDS